MRLACETLATTPDIEHGFFTRVGGVSEGIYASLNCGPGSKDNIESVMKNRAIVTDALGASQESLCVAHQIHSAKAVTVDTPWHWQESPQADAMVTSKPGIALGVLTADCLPILMADGENRVIAAVHAGWKGSFDGVIEAAISKMQQLGASLSHITASIGPGIAQQSYEVSGEFYARFLQQNIINQRYFLPARRENHYFFDLKGYAAGRLEKSGIQRINILAHDTCMDENAFFSFRRATLKGEPAYGRQISVIMLKNK